MIYFTSDLHFDHVNILRYTKRPWKDMDEMREGIINNYNAMVQPEDECYILGDLMFGSRQTMSERMEKIFPRMNGKKYLIRGNHDYKNSDEPWFKKHFVWVRDYHEIKMKHYPMLDLFHYPIASWHGIGRGAIQIHGHCHSNIDKLNRNTRRIDVGIDAEYSGYAPISIDKIVSIMKERRAEIIDHHGKEEVEL